MAVEKIEDLRAAILEMIRRGADQPLDDPAFNELALRLFTYQICGTAVVLIHGCSSYYEFRCMWVYKFEHPRPQIALLRG